MEICPATPQNGETVTLLREQHRAYLREPKNDPTSKVDWLNLRETQEDISTPLPVVFTYAPPIDGEITLICPDGTQTQIPAQNGRAEAYNLMIGAAYEWYVRAGGAESVRVRFFTDPTPPRMLAVEGISNVRDFGGFPTRGGKRIRQGLLYRTSELDTHVSVTEAGKETLYALGVRTDVDLRGVKDEPRGPVLDPARVAWVNFAVAAYGEIFTPEQVAAYGKSFAFLADEARFPAIVHCWGGIDRTGTWLYLLGAALGVEEAWLDMDYEFSSFSRWGRRSHRSEQFCAFRAELGAFGEDLQTAARAYLRAGGVTQPQIDRLAALFTEESYT